MNQKQDILQNLTSLPKFQSMPSKKTYFISHIIPYKTILMLIDLARQTKQFIIQTKRYYNNSYPALIQIMFSYELTLHTILIETLHLPRGDSIAFAKIQHLLYIILLPSNTIQSWGDIKDELRLFLNIKLFLSHQIEDMRVINVKSKFQDWFRETFVNIELNNVSHNDWNLEMAIAFMFREHLDTTLLTSSDWNIGLFFQVYPDHHESLFNSSPGILSLPKPDPYRTMHIKYAVHECIAIKRIVSVFENPWAQNQTERFLKKYYNVLPSDNTFSSSICNID